MTQRATPKILSEANAALHFSEWKHQLFIQIAAHVRINARFYHYANIRSATDHLKRAILVPTQADFLKSNGRVGADAALVDDVDLFTK